MLDKVLWQRGRRRLFKCGLVLSVATTALVQMMSFTFEGGGSETDIRRLVRSTQIDFGVGERSRRDFPKKFICDRAFARWFVR